MSDNNKGRKIRGGSLSQKGDRLLAANYNCPAYADDKADYLIGFRTVLDPKKNRG